MPSDTGSEYMLLCCQQYVCMRLVGLAQSAKSLRRITVWPLHGFIAYAHPQRFRLDSGARICFHSPTGLPIWQDKKPKLTAPLSTLLLCLSNGYGAQDDWKEERYLTAKSDLVGTYLEARGVRFAVIIDAPSPEMAHMPMVLGLWCVFH